MPARKDMNGGREWCQVSTQAQSLQINAEMPPRHHHEIFISPFVCHKILTGLSLWPWPGSRASSPSHFLGLWIPAKLLTAEAEQCWEQRGQVRHVWLGGRRHPISCREVGEGGMDLANFSQGK